MPPDKLLDAYFRANHIFVPQVRRTLDQFDTCDLPLERARIMQLIARPNWLMSYVVGQGSETFRSALLQALERIGATVTFYRQGSHAPEIGNAIRFMHHSRGLEPGLWHYKMAYLPFMFHFDRRGYSGWSEMQSVKPVTFARIDQAAADQFFAGAAAEITRNRISKGKQAATTSVPEPGYVFFALQVPDDSVISLCFEKDYIATVETAIRSVLAAGHRVVVKPHPFGRWPRLLEMLDGLVGPAMEVNDGSIHDLLPGSLAVVTANSGVGFEALLHEKTVLCLAQADYGHACHEVRDARETGAVLATALKKHDLALIRRVVFAAMTRYQVDVRKPVAMDRQVLRALCEHLTRVRPKRSTADVIDEN
ncbi:hypothetical protein Rmf_19310 [Roseomonas fluvialis]|uniref:Capsule polysaccharide biosynthesis protein n=1 Tax=Roseomonas fluvialis TaxID=1750527 RepID=A0ABN6P005_9PROT|nr:hypothetical protein Rmf_19310 [Roseomonas fluvialis]